MIIALSAVKVTSTCSFLLYHTHIFTGIIPIEGHIPTLTDENYPKFLTVGPMTRFASDLAPLLKVMAGDKASVLDLDKPVKIDQLKVN